MKLKKTDIIQLVVTGLLIITAVTIASLTIGRDIYYGSGENGLLSFAIVSFSGYLFFLFIPVEIAFVYYLPGDINTLALNAVALGTALLAQSIDYLIGYIFSTKIIDRLIGRRRYLKAEDKLRKYGNIAIFVFNFLPLSSPVISLVAGMLKHRRSDAIRFTLSGLALKYALLSLIFG